MSDYKSIIIYTLVTISLVMSGGSLYLSLQAKNSPPLNQITVTPSVAAQQPISSTPGAQTQPLSTNFFQGSVTSVQESLITVQSSTTVHNVTTLGPIYSFQANNTTRYVHSTQTVDVSGKVSDTGKAGALSDIKVGSFVFVTTANTIDPSKDIIAKSVEYWNSTPLSTTSK